MQLRNIYWWSWWLGRREWWTGVGASAVVRLGQGVGTKGGVGVQTTKVTVSIKRGGPCTILSGGIVHPPLVEDFSCIKGMGTWGAQIWQRSFFKLPLAAIRLARFLHFITLVQALLCDLSQFNLVLNDYVRRSSVLAMVISCTISWYLRFWLCHVITYIGDFWKLLTVTFSPFSHSLCSKVIHACFLTLIIYHKGIFPSEN